MKLSYENCKPLSKPAKPARRFRKRYAVIGFFALMFVIGNVVKEPTPATAAGASTGTRGMSDYEACLHNKQQLNELEAGLGDKSMNCEGVKAWKAPQERINAAGGRTALIRKTTQPLQPAPTSSMSTSPTAPKTASTLWSQGASAALLTADQNGITVAFRCPSSSLVLFAALQSRSQQA